MPISRRITIPVTCALLVVVVLGGFLFWQLEKTRVDLEHALKADVSGGASSTDTNQPAAAQNMPLDASDPLTLLRQGDIFTMRGDWKGAQEQYQRAVDAGGGLTALRKLAQAQLNRRDVHGAQDTLDQLRREGARSEDVLLLESIIHLRTGELEKAGAVLNAAQDSPQKHYGLALLAIVVRNHEVARNELGLVLNGWEPVLRSYAKVLNNAYDEYALFPKSPEIHLLTLLSRSLAQVQECELALPLLSQVTSIQDDYRDAWIVQGFCELSSERGSEALASLERAYQLDPEKPETQYFLARAYSMQSDHANAITFLQYALQNGFEPASEANRLLASEALAAGNPQLALDTFGVMTQLPDSSIDTYRDYVNAAIQADRKEEALVKAQEAVQKWAQDARAFDLLGVAKLATGDKDGARAAFDDALRLDAKLPSALEHRSQL